MRHITFLFILIFLTNSCNPYKEFISVIPRNNIPDGTQYIIVDVNLESVKEALKNSGIMIRSLEGGFETEELLLDEGTRAMYKVHDFDNQSRISAFWGITQKVRSNIALWAGYEAASAYDVHAWNKVIYNKREARSKRVFDYAIQILESNNIQYSLR